MIFFSVGNPVPGEITNKPMKNTFKCDEYKCSNLKYCVVIRFNGIFHSFEACNCII